MRQLFSDPSLIKISSWSTLKCVLYSQSHGEQMSDWPDLSLEKASKREGYQEFCVYGWVANEESYCIEISLHSLNEWNKVSLIDPELRATIWLVLIPCDPILVNKWSKSPVAQMVKNLQCGRLGFDPWVRKIPWRRKWLPTPIFLPGESHAQRNLVGYSPCCRK